MNTFTFGFGLMVRAQLSLQKDASVRDVILDGHALRHVPDAEVPARCLVKVLEPARVVI